MTSTSKTVNRALVATLVAAFLGWMFDGLEMGIFPLVARPALQEFQSVAGAANEQFVQHWMGVVTATFLLGAAAGGLVFGWLGDRIGRVRSMTLSILVYSVFTGLNYFARQPSDLALFRFISALGMGGEWSLGVALVMEAWPEGKRPLMAGLIGMSSNVGFALVALIGFFFQVTVHSWRWVMLVGALPALLALAIVVFVPESERWKQSVLSEGQSRPLREIFGPKLVTRTLLGILIASIPLIVTWGIVLWIPLWADQMTGGTQPRVKALSLLVIALGGAAGAMVAPLIGKRIGRRPVYVGLCLVSFAACSILFRAFHAYSGSFLVFAALVGFTSSSFYGWMPQYMPELFPTRVRATGQGVCYNFGRILTAVSAWKMGSLMAWFDNSYAHAGAALVFIYVIGIIGIWFLPETIGRPLPD
jgi:SHS family sialic acid transporter-like MFS transporter